MNFYPRYPAHYVAKTLHLTMEQDGAYTRLLDWCYMNERPVPHSQRYSIARATKASEKKAVDAVLSEFFSREGEVWENDRVEQEIAAAQPKIAAAKANGRKGGNPYKKQLYNEPGFLYLADCQGKGVKVGITTSPPKRLYGLRKTHGRNVSFLRVFPVSDMGLCEQQVLDEFSAFADGEMLAVHGKQLDEVIQFAESLSQPNPQPDRQPTGVATGEAPQSPIPNSPPDTEDPPHAQGATGWGCFEGHDEDTPTPPNPAAPHAIALTRAGVDVTTLNPDLQAAVAEGITPEDLVTLAGLKEFRGKPAAYVIRAARRMHAEKAAPITAGATHASTGRLSAADRVQANIARRRRERGELTVIEGTAARVAN